MKESPAWLTTVCAPALRLVCHSFSRFDKLKALSQPAVSLSNPSMGEGGSLNEVGHSVAKPAFSLLQKSCISRRCLCHCGEICFF
jgi:hypothetical protein